MKEVRVDEGEDVDVFFRYKRRVSGSTSTTPLDLSGASAIELIVKNSLADDDVTEDKFTYSVASGDIIVTDDGVGGSSYSEIKVKVKGVDQTPPGNYYFKTKVTKASRTETIDKGIWRIENT